MPPQTGGTDRRGPSFTEGSHTPGLPQPLKPHDLDRHPSLNTPHRHALWPETSPFPPWLSVSPCVNERRERHQEGPVLRAVWPLPPPATRGPC